MCNLIYVYSYYSPGRARSASATSEPAAPNKDVVDLSTSHSPGCVQEEVGPVLSRRTGYGSPSSNNTKPDELNQALVRSTSLIGTLEYMAPEVIIMFGKRRLHRHGYSCAVDFWSLGIMIYKLLTGVEPFVKFTYSTLLAMFPQHLAGYVSYKEAFDALFGVINYGVGNGVLGEDTRSLLGGLLNFREEDRLGYSVDNINAAHQTLRSHSFFRSIDWDLLENKLQLPPYIPHNETLGMMSVGAEDEGRSLCRLLKEVNKSAWCEEFLETDPLTPFSSSGGGDGDGRSQMRIRETDQYYFRTWSYVHPSVMNS